MRDLTEQEFIDLQQYWAIDRVYTGPKYGWMATWTDRSNPANVWGFQNGRWFHWNGYYWQVTVYRDRIFFGQLFVGLVISVPLFVAAGINSNPESFAYFLLGMAALVPCFLLFVLQNRAPRAYEVASVLIAGYWGARATRAFFRD